MQIYLINKKSGPNCFNGLLVGFGNDSSPRSKVLFRHRNPPFDRDISLNDSISQMVREKKTHTHTSYYFGRKKTIKLLLMVNWCIWQSFAKPFCQLYWNLSLKFELRDYLNVTKRNVHPSVHLSRRLWPQQESVAKRTCGYPLRTGFQDHMEKIFINFISAHKWNLWAYFMTKCNMK